MGGANAETFVMLTSKLDASDMFNNVWQKERSESPLKSPAAKAGRRKIEMKNAAKANFIEIPYYDCTVLFITFFRRAKLIFESCSPVCLSVRSPESPVRNCRSFRAAPAAFQPLVFQGIAQGREMELRRSARQTNGKARRTRRARRKA